MSCPGPISLVEILVVLTEEETLFCQFSSLGQFSYFLCIYSFSSKLHPRAFNPIHLRLQGKSRMKKSTSLPPIQFAVKIAGHHAIVGKSVAEPIRFWVACPKIPKLLPGVWLKSTLCKSVSYTSSLDLILCLMCVMQKARSWLFPGNFLMDQILSPTRTASASKASRWRGKLKLFIFN